MADSDKLSILSHSTNLLAKVWKTDGTLKQYDQAKHFTVDVREVADIDGASALLSELERNPHACLIRGAFVGYEEGLKRDKTCKPGWVRRTLSLFDDQPLHLILIEVDTFEPLTADPQTDPLGAITEYIQTRLPYQFHNVSYHWQLSNSAGRPNNKNKLKVHLWFWLKTAYTSMELRFWATEMKIDCDKAVFNAVQVHYTAAPVFEAGVDNPIVVRSGFFRWGLNDVALTIPEEIVSRATQASKTKKTKDRSGNALVPATAGAVIKNDEVASFLDEQGLINGFGKENQIFITCPFSSEHTAESKFDSTCYFPKGTGGYDRGHFKCFHGHCASRTDSDFENALGYTISQFDDLTDKTLTVKEERARALATRLSHLSMIPDPKNYVDMANKFLQHSFFDFEEEKALLLRNKEVWYAYASPVYREVSEGNMRSATWKFLSDSRVKEESGWLNFRPSTPTVNTVLDALRAFTINDNVRPPSWLDKNKNGSSHVILSNGILNVSKRELTPHTPEFFSLNALPFEWNPAAKPDKWLKFLEQVFPGDSQSQQTLQEIMGYLLVDDTSQQKMFLFFGAPRSGKGTIARIITAMLGRENTCAPTLASLAGEFGMQPMINKLLAVIPDARLSGQQDKQLIVEKLLMISGEDDVTVNRKHVPQWEGRLSARILMMSNEIPQFSDASGAMAGRFVKLFFKQGFYGREDTELTKKLLAELPGIFQWALEGLDRLRARGYFVEPDSVLEATQDMEYANSPIKEFLKEKCVLDAAASVNRDALYYEWRSWCISKGIDHPGTSAKFGKDLRAARPELTRFQPRGIDGKQENRYMGIRLAE